MADFKALAKDTAIYGLSSIVGRFLNYLLVPLYTYKISAASGGVATPFAYCLYAASFGTAGGIAAKAHDETEREQLQTAVQSK